MDKYFIEKFGDKVKLIDKKYTKEKDINEEYIVWQRKCSRAYRKCQV